MSRPCIWQEGPEPDRDTARIPVTDRGWLFGQGLFETVLVKEHRPFRLAAHLERMENSALALGLPLPAAGWRDRVTQALEALAGHLQDGQEGRARLTLTAGDAHRGGDPAAAAAGPARLVLTVLPLEPRSRSYDTAVFGGPPAPGGRDALTAHKTVAYLRNLLCLQEARRAGAGEGLVRTSHGRIVGGSRSNLFLVRDGGLETPGRRSGCLPGITRRIILEEVAPSLSLAAVECDLRESSLIRASEAFLVNSLWGVLPLSQVGERVFSGPVPGPVTCRIIKIYLSLLARDCGTK